MGLCCNAGLVRFRWVCAVVQVLLVSGGLVLGQKYQEAFDCPLCGED